MTNIVLHELQFKDWQKFSVIKGTRVADPLAELRSLSKGQATYSFSTEDFISSKRSQERLKMKKKTAFLGPIIKEKGTG